LAAIVGVGACTRNAARLAYHGGLLIVTTPMPAKHSLRYEIKATTRLAAPLVLGQLSSVAMSVVDTVLAGWHSPTTLAAVAVGSAIWSVVILVLIGVLMAVPPIIAQLNGAGRRAEIGSSFRQALWLALVMGIALMVLVRNAQWMFDLARIAPQVRPEALAFLDAIGWGAPALALYFCLRYLSEGVSWAVPTMLFGIAGLLLLAPLGYALMFGHWRLPELGAAGLGYATAVVLWIQVLGFAGYLAYSSRFRDLQLFTRWEAPRWAAIRELLRIGLPMGVAIFMEGSLFVVSALLIGRIGAIDVAAHQIAINLSSVTFMVPLGVAMATTVRVGHAVGMGDPDGVRGAAKAGYSIVLVTQVGAGLIMFFGNHWLVGLYTQDVAVAAVASSLLLYAAAFQLPDGIQALSGGALRGLKDTRMPMFITVLAYWLLGMPLGAGLAFGLGWGAQGMWAGLIMGLSAAAGLLSWRFVRLARDPCRRAVTSG